ncbi:MAG: glycosyltransferase, partial [Eubacteriales bacterium]|nr:glycosyltransferase [Eubacteriales bacterium]
LINSGIRLYKKQKNLIRRRQTLQGRIMDKITAVVPARNCRRMLHRCLTALSGTESVSKIIVVDDGSEDGTAEMLRSRWPAVTSLLLPAHTGRVHALNAGLRLVRTEYAFVILPDLQPSKSCVKKLLRALQRENEKISCRRGTEETGENTGFGDGAVFCAVPSFFDGIERAEAPRAADSRKREAASHMTEDAR